MDNESKLEVQQEIGRFSLFSKGLTTILLSITAAACVSMFGFLWNINSKIAIMEERDRAKSDIISSMQSDINALKLNGVDMRIKMTTMEVKLSTLETFINNQK